MTERSDHFVLILGAGFSAERGFPVMSRFKDVALELRHRRSSETHAELDRCYKDYFDFKLRCEQSSRAIQRDWENIEDLYTQADLLRLIGFPTPQDATRICTSIAWVIWDVYRCVRGPESTNTSPYTDKLSRLMEWALTSKLSPVIVTTNYDLVAESALAKNGREFSYAGFDEPSQHQLRLARQNIVKRGDMSDGVVRIMKLHGSVNWFNAQEQVVCSYEVSDLSIQLSIMSDWQSPTSITNAISVFLNTGVGASVKLSPGDVTPAIIPPMLGKAAVGGLTAVQWTSAIEAVRRAKHICVIGYSFPETDAFMTRILVEGLHSNEGCETFLIIDNGRESAWRSKIRSMFTPSFRDKRCRVFRIESSTAMLKLAQYGYLEVYKGAAKIEPE